MAKLKPPKRSIRSFEVDPQTARLLKLAIESTGRRQTDLINTALSKYLGPLVKHIAKERQKAYKRFDEEWSNRGQGDAKYLGKHS